MNLRKKKPAPPPPPEAPAGPVDMWLLGLLFLILVCGIMSVLSAGGPYGQRIHGSSTYFFTHQLMFLGMGSLIILIVCMMPRWFINKLHYPAIFGTILLLAACLVIGSRLNGSRRWIPLGPLNLQPMEFARIALVSYLGYFFSSKQHIITSATDGNAANFANLLPPLLFTLIIIALLLLQPDLGGAALILGTYIAMAFVGGARKRFVFGFIILAAAALAVLILVEPYRMSRFLAFLNPFDKSMGDPGYQLRQSLFALGRGGLFGAGIGGSLQKLKNLPEAHNDFILAVIGEEVGFIGVAVLMFLFAVFLWRCFLVALHQPILRDRITAFGLSSTLTISVLFNIAVVYGGVPPKGVALPFISYGGSSLVANMLCAGLLLHYSRTSRE